MLRFVVPELGGPSTGGTVYNRELLRALAGRGAAFDTLDLVRAERALAAGEPGAYWIDTLFLAEFPRLRGLAGGGQRLGLIAHYLPALVRYGAAVTRAELSPDETFALDHADAFVAPSGFMRAALERLGARSGSVTVAEPGRLAPGVAPFPEPSAALRAVVVAHLVAGKGVDRLLAAFATHVEPADALTLEIAGSLTQDAAYAEGCRVFATAPALRERVTLLGELTPDAVNERLRACDVLLSASSMESFGMALAEARTLGVPIVARAGGNVENLVSPASGGELVGDASGVALACLALCRNPAELTRRRERARAGSLPARSWNRTADEFLPQPVYANCEKGPMDK
ncbi:MAG TPA: glycosyltransferase family 4 protein [Polyangiaceae bacterium]|nr:glycosyltransferase family 4 protein [Polyangiaceae bacterium]